MGEFTAQESNLQEKNRTRSEAPRKQTRWVLTDRDLALIAAYKYSPGTYTWMDNVMTPFWNWIVKFLPAWLAPNLVTFSGLSLVMFTTGVLILFDPTLKGDSVPPCLWMLYSASIFAYQTLDAIDGKHARRTNSSSPLGQVFDHGCDTVVKVFFVAGVSAAMGFGSSWRTVVLYINTEFAFYLAQWEEYHTGTLNWSNGWWGVTESQLLQIAIFAITAVAGPGLWHLPLGHMAPLPAPADNWSIADVAMTSFCFVTTTMFITSVQRVIPASAEQLPQEERGDKSVGIGPGLVQLLPMLAVFCCAFSLSVGAGESLFAQQPALQLLGWGCVSCHITSRMIIHHIAKQHLLFEDFTPSVFFMIICTALVHGKTLGLAESPLDRRLVLTGTLLFGLLCYLRYIIGAVRDICNFLDIHCFNITPRAAHKSL